MLTILQDEWNDQEEPGVKDVIEQHSFGGGRGAGLELSAEEKRDDTIDQNQQDDKNAPGEEYTPYWKSLSWM